MTFSFPKEIKVTTDFLVPAEVLWKGAGLTPKPQSASRYAPPTRASDYDGAIRAAPRGLGRSEEEISLQEPLGCRAPGSQGEALTYTLLYCALPKQLGDGSFSSMTLGMNRPCVVRQVCCRKCFSPHHFQSLYLLSFVGPDPYPTLQGWPACHAGGLPPSLCDSASIS